jgi:hypothetical protein
MPDFDRSSTAGSDGAAMKITGIALVASIAAIAACGGDDAPTAASCAESWNANANAKQQATLVGVRAVDVLVGDRYRVGTWPNGEQTVSVTEGFSDVAKGHDAVVNKNACVVLLPDSRLGQMAFVETDGKWGFVRGEKATFPDAAAKSIAGAKNAQPDALGKLALQS